MFLTTSLSRELVSLNPFFVDLSEGRLERYPSWSFKIVLDYLKIGDEENVISEFQNNPGLCGRLFKIIWRDKFLNCPTFLHFAYFFLAEKVADYTLKCSPHLVNLICPLIGKRPLDYLVENANDIAGSRLLSNLLNQENIHFYKIEKRCNIKERGKSFLLSDRVIRITNDESNQELLKNNLIFKAAFLGKRLMFENMLGFFCKKDIFSTVMTHTNLSIDVAQIIKSYCPYIITEAVQDVATLTCEDFVEESFEGVVDSYIEYRTPFQEALKGLERAISKESMKQYLELARLLLDCGERLDRFPSLKRGRHFELITSRYKHSFPEAFWEKLTNTVAMEELTDELFDFRRQLVLQKRR